MSKGRQTHRSTGGKRKRPAPPAVATNTAPQAPATPRHAPPVAPTRYGTTSARASAAPAKAVDFSTEYHYVLGDLKRIGILAAASFAVLVALALLIR
jgi:hypothetical protein